jgi:hypothetical protein
LVALASGFFVLKPKSGDTMANQDCKKIAKAIDSQTSYKKRFSSDWINREKVFYQVFGCLHCGKHAAQIERIEHDEDCPVLIARRILDETY